MAARNFTLDLNSSASVTRSSKRTRMVHPTAAGAPVLTTPDVQMLKLSSPELAKFLNAQNIATPTPFPKTVTEEQELYAKGFEDALKKVRKTETVAPHSHIIPQSVQGMVTIKEEELEEDEQPENLSSTAPVSPIDMEVQESAKLERKRARNRLAASKCRKRKLERIAHLDDRVNVLKEENADLAAVVKRLKAAVCDLKQEVMEHVNNGCQIMVSEGVAF